MPDRRAVDTDQSLNAAGAVPGDIRKLPTLAWFLTYAIGVVLVVVALSPGSVWAGPKDGQLVDTDGYMRYLRIEQLAEGGPWFDPVSERSNYPFGETQHWTRPVDVYVLSLVTILGPGVDDGLHWASVLNAPLLLLVLGVVVYRACWALPDSVRPFSMLMLLGLLPVLSYGQAGRVDHHMAILVAFVATVGALLRGLADPSRIAWPAGLLMGVGIWLSTEFLVPIALFGATLSLIGVWRGRSALARHGARVFAWLTLSLVGILAVERGGRWQVVELDRVSVAHLGLAAAGALAFFLLGRFTEEGATPRLRNLGVLLIVVAAVSLPLLIAFPGLASGPFGDVDARVKELWLYTVQELRPVWSTDLATGWLLMAPIAAGIAGGCWMLVGRTTSPLWVPVLTTWTSAYAVLTSFQVRWAMFGQVLSIPLILMALSPWLARLGESKVRLVRPLAVVALSFGVLLVGSGLIAAFGSEESGRGTKCDLGPAIDAMASLPQTTVLAGQDDGPEILYRTHHRVVATPYHRNESGLMYANRLTALASDQEMEALAMLADRQIGLLLICDGAAGILRPREVEGSLYQALTTGSAPSFLVPVPIEADTDYQLYAVDA